VLVLDEESASEVAERLRAGEDWGAVAEAFSRDDEAKVHRGDIGWHRYGQQPFSLYQELQERAFDMPVGGWEGPIREGGEYHFLKAIAERPRAGVTRERAWAEARNLLAERKQADMMQAFTNRMWERGGYHLDEDQFHWWYDRLQASFRTDPTNNPVPQLSREDQARVIVRSSRNRPYTARMLNERVELINPRARRMDITGGDINDWRRKILSDWILVDEIADYARSRGYHRDPSFLATQERYIDGRLYALKLEELRRSVTALSDEQLLGYWRANRRALNQPDRRELTEVLLATREEAEEIRRRAQAGQDLEELAARHTIRQGFRDLRGRFSPISRGEFGALGEAVFETPDGEIGPIVETPLGFSVFRVTTVHPARETTFEEMQQPMREALLQEGQQAVVNEFTQQAFERARIWKDEELLRRFTEEMVELATEMKERREAEDEAEARAQAEWEEQIRRQLPPRTRRDDRQNRRAQWGPGGGLDRNAVEHGGGLRQRRGRCIPGAGPGGRRYAHPAHARGTRSPGDHGPSRTGRPACLDRPVDSR
jgi:parvulin-like peptidyl-prolyl isomerase